MDTRSPFNLNFSEYFDHLPEPYLIVMPDDNLTMVAANLKYFQVTLTTKESLLNKGIFEVFTQTEADAAQHGGNPVRESFQQVIKTKEPHTMRIIKYDIKNPKTPSGFEQRYWAPINYPILDEEKEIKFIINCPNDITDTVLLQKKSDEQAQKTLLAESSLERTRDAYESMQQVINVLCHDMRNPMIGMADGVDTMKSDLKSLEEELSTWDDTTPMTPERLARLKQYVSKTSKTVSVIETCLAQQQTSIDDMAKFTQIKENKLVLQIQPFSIKKALYSVFEKYKARAALDDIEFILEDKIADEYVKGDPECLMQIFKNLFAQSLKSTPKGGRVTVFVQQAKNHGNQATYEFQIKDNSIGLTAEEQAKLFLPFGQSNASVLSQLGSSCFGTVLTKHFIESMQGQIKVLSIPGQTTYHFTITLETLPFSLEEEKSAETRLQVSSQQDNHPVPPKPLKVLIVEDNKINQKILETMLLKEKFDCLVADNGQEGMQIWEKREDIDIILMDIEMPVMDGLEATKKIRRTEAEQHKVPLPILCLSGNNITSVDALKADGMSGFLQKPYKRKKILSVIEDLVSHYWRAKAETAKAEAAAKADPTEKTPLLPTLKGPTTLFAGMSNLGTKSTTNLGKFNLRKN